MKKIICLLLYATLLNHANAADLMEVYKDAIQNDQMFNQAISQLRADKELLPQARAALLPSVGVTAKTGVYANYSKPENTLARATNKAAYTYGLKVTQVLFDWSAKAKLRSAKASVKRAAATFIAAEQALILRTARAYFGILESQANLHDAITKEKTAVNTLNIAKQRYQVGLNTATEVYQARADYNKADIAYLKCKLDLVGKQEVLRLITNKIYPTLNPLQNNLPLLAPEPADLEVWTKTTLANNVTLKAARFDMLAAQDDIATEAGHHLPTLSLGAAYDNAPAAAVSSAQQTRDLTAMVGLEASFEIYHGGFVNSQVRAAQARYQIASTKMEATYRGTVSKVRTDYLNIAFGISQIKAGRQAISSSLKALESIRAGYKVGTVTLSEVLEQQDKLYEARTTYVKDLFTYLVATLALREDAGSLSVSDLSVMNQRLATQLPASAAVLKPAV